jgi:hypothetical protein
LDSHAFGHFAPLLEACQQYAQRSGYRFQGFSFEALSLEPPATDANSDQPEGALAVPWKEGDLILSAAGASPLEPVSQLLLAEVKALPTARTFQERMRSGEAALLADLAEAFHVMIEEGVRNSMIGTCTALELWPPPHEQVRDVSSDDCSFQDTSASMPVIAQRLFNDERRRRGSAEGPSTLGGGAWDPARKRAATASFLTDFAVEAGVETPPMEEDCKTMITAFNARASEWEKQVQAERRRLRQQRRAIPPPRCKLEDPLWEATDMIAAGRMIRSDLKSWWTRRNRSA